MITEMQIKPTIRYHLTPVRMAIINKSTHSVGGYVEKGEPFCTVGGNADWCSSYGKHYGGSFLKIKNESAFGPRNPTSGNISKGTQNTNLKHPYVSCRVIYNRQDTEAAQVSISRWEDKTTMGYLHNGILLSYKKEENFTFCDSVNGPGEHYAKWNKPGGERQIPYDLTYKWNLINKTNKQA